MRFKVKRKAKTNWHQQWERDIKDAAIWSAEQLGILRKDAVVEFVLKNDSKVEYGGVVLTMNPFKRFVVILNACYLGEWEHVLETVIHEMTHVAQEFHQGLAITDCLTEAHYEGMVYNFENAEQFNAAYYELPWEIDARESADLLLPKYKKFLTFAA
jgi:hypothetical protein